MYPTLITNFLTDYETLREYEEDPSLNTVIPFSQIRRRLIGIARKQDPTKNDSFYEGLGEMYLEKYGSTNDLVWQLPYELARHCLFWKGNHVYIKKECFEEWMGLITVIPPTLLLAAFFMDGFSLDMLPHKKDMGEFIGKALNQFAYTAQPIPFLPDLNYVIHETNGLNDLHIHLNGSTESDIIWQYMLHHPLITLKHYDTAYRKESVKKLGEQIIGNFTPKGLQKRIEHANLLKNRILTYAAVQTGLINTQNALRLNPIYIPEFWGDFKHSLVLTPVIDEIMFCMITMSTLRKTNYGLLGSWFHHYLLIKGLIHQFTVMQRSQIGFPQFQLLTENSFRWGVDSFYRQRFLQLAGNAAVRYLDMLEGRFSPQDNSVRNHYLISNIIKGFESAQKDNSFLTDTKLVLIAHFIKRKESKDEMLFPIRHRFLRKNLKKKAIALAVLLKSNASTASYIKGIDAAANEMDTGPEVFSHTFRFLKRNGIPHCTYHVGEDFKHLLTGLRTICEAIDFLELQTGDRLGHCTAVGISPDTWRKRVGKTCILSQGEWLDNLVFVWYIIKESQNEQLQPASVAIESQIAEFSYKIYGNSYPPYLLVEAWKLRKYNPILYLEQDAPTIGDDWDWVDSPQEADKIREKIERHENLRRIWEIYHRIIGDGSEYDKPIEVETDKIISTNQLHILQCIILEKMAKEGIVIEALPSSNLCISYYKYLNEYHLKRWLNTERQDTLLPPIVLGTDDPGIFMTNIYNEYARTYLHLETQGRSSSNRIKKITDLHRDSQTYNFNNA